MPRHYRVLKPVTVNGMTYDRGEVVDATGWRTLRQLVSQRKLAPAEREFAAPSPEMPRVARRERTNEQPSHAR